ncbi:MAG TPA: RNA 2',3'-cyclic phosphodiesterase [Solirubrobacteraceae bacterium]|nr:RNA 2',3'-cyclic phosphodiesterase [Solirubrobacteraceae bacterium]
MTRSHTARLFVAIDPPGDVCEQLVHWARSAVRGGSDHARGAMPLRVLDPESLHVTLCFLGNRPVGELDSLGTQLAACGGPTGELSLGAPLWLPARHPRALAVELHDDLGKLARLQAEVASALGEVSGWQPNGGVAGGEGASRGRRRFHPHVTVARMRHGATDRRSTPRSGHTAGSSIGQHERVLPPTPSLAFVPRELVLYRSWLSPEGASYEAIASHPIG